MNDHRNWREKWETKRRNQNPNSHIWFGVILIVVGLAAFARAAFFDLPSWLFTWPMILILIGLFSGIKHNFRNNGWWIMMLIGGYFLLDDVMPGFIGRQYFWPVAIIIFGIIMITKPRRRWDDWNTANTNTDQPKNSTGTTIPVTPGNTAGSTHSFTGAENAAEEYLDVAAVFGGVKKSVYSKNFKGGKITCVFGGGEINLLQADFTGTAVLDMTAVFGGCTLIIPSHWQLKINSTPFFGGIDDKRQQPSVISYDKQLVITGGVVFGGVEIKSY